MIPFIKVAVTCGWIVSSVNHHKGKDDTEADYISYILSGHKPTIVLSYRNLGWYPGDSVCLSDNDSLTCEETKWMQVCDLRRLK